MDRLSVVKWLRANPDVDVTSLANEAKSAWDCECRAHRTVAAILTDAGSVRAAIRNDGALSACVYLKPDDAAAFARHILELVKP